MSDALRYRIPGEDVVIDTGAFKPYNGEKGFVVTSFNKEQKFVFVSGSKVSTSQYSASPTETLKEDYFGAAKKVVADLKNSGGKAILSRIKKEVLLESSEVLFEKLVEAYPKAFVYLISSELFGIWIGATPETLIVREGVKGRSMALAGTRKTNEKRDWTSKEVEEHEMVADFIEQKLGMNDVESVQRFDREDSISGPVEHLMTRFEFDLNPKKEWELAMDLHPTPAVSGFPRDRALKLIQRVENHDRSLYAGVIGVLGKDTNIYVNLRCAQIVGNEMFLYLGGGYTKDSVPEEEWEETENKAKTLLNVLKKE